MRFLKRFTPVLAKFVVGCGTRTLYAYLLHWTFFLVPSMRTTFHAEFMDITMDHGPFRKYLFLFGFTLIVNFALSCSLMECLFGWMTQAPFWVVDYFDGTRANAKARDTKLAQASDAEATAQIGGS